MAGRSIVLPRKIHKVMGMSPVGLILIYTLAPEKLAGWCYPPGPGELAFVAPLYRNLPVLGGWYGRNNTGNLEAIIKAHPDVILSMGDTLGVVMAERLQKQTGIPVVVLEGGLKNLPDAYRKAGELLDAQPRAAMLAEECRRTITEVEEKVKSIPPDKRRTYYYAEGPAGLETDPGGSPHSETMEFAGGVNVATVPMQGGYGQTPVSMEHVMKWNPEIVISGYDHTSSPGQFYTSVWSNPLWKRVRALQKRDVYEAPQYPYNWVDRPPSVNRIIGLKWLANLFYPELFHYDMRSETRAFYSTFYHVQLTDAQLDQLLATATRKH
jgi:iron complex transport system substrate-binding protein